MGSYGDNSVKGDSMDGHDSPYTVSKDKNLNRDELFVPQTLDVRQS